MDFALKSPFAGGAIKKISYNEAMEYKGYQASACYNAQFDAFIGETTNTSAMISFDSPDEKGLQKAFEDAVDDYLAWCAESGEKPEAPRASWS